MIEARSMVFDMSGIPINEQLKMPNSEWYDMYQVAIKKHKQKLEIMAMNRY